MKQKMKYISMLALVSLMLNSSCSKDDDDDSPPAPPTKSQLLVAVDWQVTALTVDPPLVIQGGAPITNLIPIIPACSLDDIFNYNADGTYSFEEGLTKCDPNDPQVYESGTWQWNSDQTRLVQNNGGETTDVLVTSLTATEMKWEETQVEQGVTYTFTYTFN
jgi:hypothetical protein